MASSISSLGTIMERNRDGSTNLVRVAGSGRRAHKENGRDHREHQYDIATIQDMAN
jgi:hypothetical protein